MSISIETTKTKDKILISIPISNINEEEIEDFLSFLKTEFTARKSTLTKTQAEEISEQIKSDWWERNNSRIKKIINENG